MNFEKIYQEMQPEILQAAQNTRCKQLLDNADNLGGQAKIMVKCMIAIAYKEGLKDGYEPSSKNIRI